MTHNRQYRHDGKVCTQTDVKKWGRLISSRVVCYDGARKVVDDFVNYKTGATSSLGRARRRRR